MTLYCGNMALKKSYRLQDTALLRSSAVFLHLHEQLGGGFYALLHSRNVSKYNKRPSTMPMVF